MQSGLARRRKNPGLHPGYFLLRLTLGIGLLALLSACTITDYYLPLVRGQYELLSKREPIAQIVKDPQRDPALRARLARLQAARAYASKTLLLPDNGSYSEYSDIGRDYVVWNVFATPKFSLDAVESCFPIAGCVAYRGYFRREDAERQAAALTAKGMDTFVGGVAAYSTLGWFDDPVISTMMRWSDTYLIGMLFHELSHQRLYVKNDTAFNESFANFVKQQGLKDYLQAQPELIDEEQASEERERDFVALILAARERLARRYTTTQDPLILAQIKQQAFADLRRDYQQLRDTRWNRDPAYDAWFDKPLNNARLLPFGLYDQWVPAFNALWQQHPNDWAAFYKAAEALGKLPMAERLQRLQALSNP